MTITSFPTLNITAPYMGKGGVKMTLQGNSVIYDDTLTGAVTSPQPYMRVEVEAQLLKSQSLANLYKQQMELNALLGQITVRGDAVSLGVYNFSNCSIMGVRPLDFSGQHADYTITIGGIYYINSSMFN